MAKTVFEINESDLKSIALRLKNARKRGKPATLLLGAGGSKSAGIPLASEIVNDVKERFPDVYDNARTKSYQDVMARLDDGERHDLFVEYVEKSRLNWAHILLGLLVKEGYIGRIVTVNFDNLVPRALALYNLFPPIFDFAASATFIPDYVSDPAICYLHGQAGGFVQAHSVEEVGEQQAKTNEVFRSFTEGRPWIVLGYSGDCDPMFENLVDIPKFRYGLFWISHGKVSTQVEQRLLRTNKQTYLVSNQDADKFFYHLFLALKLQRPSFLGDPFSHMIEILNRFQPFPESLGASPCLDALEKLSSARKGLSVQK